MSTDATSDPNSSELIITYPCPRCGQKVGVAAHRFGELVDCPACSQVFEAAPPVVRPGEGQHDSTSRVDLSEEDERRLCVIHPAMFRNHPAWHIGLLTLIATGIAYPFVAHFVYRASFQSHGIAGAMMAATGLVWLACWWIKTLATTLILTNKRVILNKGIISKQSTEVQYDDVRNIQVDQSVFDRILSVGDIAISSSGQDDLEIVANGVPDPEGIAEQIRQRQ